jgi:hypothetical protein
MQIRKGYAISVDGELRRVPEGFGQLPEEFRRTAKELRRGAVKKIFPKIFMRGYGMI